MSYIFRVRESTWWATILGFYEVKLIVLVFNNQKVMKLLNLELYPRFSLQDRLLRNAELWFFDECISTHITRNKGTNGVKEGERKIAWRKRLPQRAYCSSKANSSRSQNCCFSACQFDEKLKQHSDIPRAKKRVQELQSQIR